MRTLNTEEMDAASGGVVPLIGLALAVASTVVKHKVALIAINTAGVFVAGVGGFAYYQGVKKGQVTWDGLGCHPAGE